MSNYNGGLSAARLQFMKDLHKDKSYIEHKKTSTVEYGVVHVYVNDPYLSAKKASEIIKKFIK